MSDTVVEKVVTSGKFSLDGGEWDVDNNVWLVGNADEVIVIDAAHSAAEIMTAVAGRVVQAIICTHGHNDHINAAPELRELTKAPIFLHTDDGELWAMTHGQIAPDEPLEDGQRILVGGTELQVIHTPGHAPGAVCLYAPSLGVIFSGDTLFEGGPGATGRSFSDYPTIIDSIKTKLLTLPEDTVVHTGHGADTTIGAEKANMA